MSKQLPPEVEWLVYADSDTALNLPAIAHMLSGFDPEDRVALGQLFEHFIGTPHWGGGGGMAFSRPALDAIVDGIEREEINHHIVWPGSVQDNQVESLDMWVAECSRDANVTVLDMRGFYQYQFMGRFPEAYMHRPPLAFHRAFPDHHPGPKHSQYFEIFQRENQAACLKLL